MKILILLIWGCIIYNIIKTKLFIKDYKKHNKNIDNVKSYYKDIIIVIPVLREQNCIYDTIKYFRSIENNIPIVIVTTEKEIFENINDETTTQEIIKSKILNKFDNVYTINYPKTSGYMAHQLNYMIDNINNIFKKEINLEDTYIALYNADSRPNKNTFKKVNGLIKQGNKVIQQYSYCMKNYSDLNGILKGFAFYQSVFEINKGLINASYKNNFLYKYVVGHGLIINFKTLKKLGDFNTNFWCEDMYLTLQLKIKDIKIVPLMCLENIETPNSLEKLIKQNAVWFKTTSDYYKMYKDILKKHKVSNSLNGILGVFNEFYCTIKWLLTPIVIFLISLYLILVGNYIECIEFIVSIITFNIVNLINTIKIINMLDEQKYKINFSMIYNFLCANCISNIGPLYSIFMNKKEKYKTER